MSLANKIVFNTLVSYGGRITGSIFALVVVGLITRSLGQGGFGGYTIILAYLSLFVILADLGLQSLMTREISKHEGGGSKIASNFFTLRLISSLLFLILGFLAVFLFPYSRAVQLGIGVGAVGFFFLSVSQLLIGVFQKHLSMHMAAVAEIAGRGLQLVLVFAVYVYAGRPPFAEGYGGAQPTFHIGGALFLFVLAMSAASFVIFLLHFIFARRYVKIGLSFDFAYWRNILKTTWPIALSIVLTLVYFKIDTIFLSLMKPEADVGIYGVAYRVLESLIFFPAMFAGIMMPILSRDAVSDLAHFRQIFQKSFRVIAIFAFPTVFGGAVLAYSIANLIGGKEFVVAGAPMQALFVATGIIFFGNILGRAIIALDLQKKAVFAYLFGVVLNVILNLIFIPQYTYMGAAWTTVITEFVVIAFLFYLVRQRANISFDIVNMLKAAGAAALMAGILLILLALRSLGEVGVSPVKTPLSFLNLGFYTLLGAGVYFVVLYLLKGFNKRELLLLFKKE